jgi:NitT/TauT family transport system ATP-binding protein
VIAKTIRHGDSTGWTRCFNAAESGTISVDGKTVDGPPEHIGFMFQKDTLLPWQTVRENIEVGLALARVPPAQWTQRIADRLALLRLSEFRDVYPAQFSGGMRHRVSLGRMLAYQPAVMLMSHLARSTSRPRR